MANSELAIWRFSLIAPLLHLVSGTSLSERARELAAQAKTGPNGEPTLVSVETMLRWFRAYQAEGLDGLENQPRADRGRSRALDQETMVVLWDLAGEHPDWTIKAIHKEAQKELGKAIPIKPVYRLLAGRRRAQHPPEEHRHRPIGVVQTLWLADTWHGPNVLGERRQIHKSYLIAFMDDASRAVMAGQFGLRDDVAHLIVVFRQALLARGLPHRIITDNGSNYHSRVMRTACATLGIHLVHAPVGAATWKARLERFWLTVKEQINVPANPRLQDLQTAWARFLAEYHASPHRGLQEALGKSTSPLDYYLTNLPPEVKQVSELKLDDLLQIEETRRVNPDGTIRVARRVFEVRAPLAGTHVRVRFNPCNPARVWYRPAQDSRASFQEAFLIQ